MEKIFPNLYRFTDESHRKETLYSFLLVREDGNLLLPAQGGSVIDHFDAIDELGGVNKQLVTHNHDVSGPVHEAVQERFGAKLHHHSAEQEAVTEKTSCETEGFGDEGLALGSDFRAIYFPSCCVGSSVFHWQNEGACYLFTSHVINRVEGEWKMDLDLWQYRNLRDWEDDASCPDPRPGLTEIGELQLNYTMPNVWKEGMEEYHRFDPDSRKSFSEALAETIENESGKLVTES